MGKITTITKAEAKRIHQAVDAAMKSVAEEFGLEFRPANGSFTSSDFSTRCKFTLPLSALAQRAADTAVLPKTERSSLMFGAGQRGEAVCVQFGRLAGQKLVIAEARRTNYVVKDEQDKQWLLPFSACFPYGSTPKAEVQGKAEHHPKIAFSKPMTEDELMQRIVNVYSSLSPENLTCDGEIRNRTTIRAREKRYLTELKQWFKLLGREVSEDEAFKWLETSRKSKVLA